MLSNCKIATKCYPFGMLAQNYNAKSCRFGFNTQERTDEISGTGNHNTALFWEYDTRLSRRWNIAPVNKPSFSSYATFGNNPITCVDENGDDWYVSENGAVIWQTGNDKTIIIDGETFKNSGKEYSTPLSTEEGILYINYYQNVPVSITKSPESTTLTLLNNKKLRAKLIAKNSPLSENDKQELLKQSIHKTTNAVADFMFETTLTLIPTGRLGKAAISFSSDFLIQLNKNDGDIKKSLGDVNLLNVAVQTFVPGKSFGINVLKSALGNKYKYSLNQSGKINILDNNNEVLTKTALDAIFIGKGSLLNKTGLKKSKFTHTLYKMTNNFSKGLVKDKLSTSKKQ